MFVEERRLTANYVLDRHYRLLFEINEVPQYGHEANYLSVWNKGPVEKGYFGMENTSKEHRGIGNKIFERRLRSVLNSSKFRSNRIISFVVRNKTDFFKGSGNIMASYHFLLIISYKNWGRFKELHVNCLI